MLASSRTVLSAIRGWVVAAAALSLHRTSGFSLASQSRASTLVRQAPRAFLNSGIQSLSLRGGTSPLTAPSAFQRAPLRWTATGSASTPVGFEALSVSELKSLLAERGVDFRDCIEKRELIARLEKAMQEGRTPKSSASTFSALSPDEDRLISLFKSASPSVVFIQTTQLALESPFSMRALEVPQGTGSGFIWDDQGHIVTNFHVIEPALRSRGGNIRVSLQNVPEDYEAKVVGAEPEKDLAVLQLVKKPTSQDLTPISVGTSSELQVGQRVLAIGNPFGLDHTLTVGVVSALGREVRGAAGNVLRGCVQTDAAINPGNSGGPLLDSQGRLIGVNTAIVSPSGSFAGIGFAIPVDTVSRIVTQLVRYGRVKRPSLGLQVAEDQIMQGVLKRVNLQVEGVMVVEVAPGSPAAAPVSGRALSGVQRRSNGSILLGDVVTRVNNSPVKKVEDLLSAVEECEVGSVVELAVKRQGQGPEERVRVRLTEQQQRRSPL